MQEASSSETIIASTYHEPLSLATVSRYLTKARNASGISFDGDPPTFHELRSLSRGYIGTRLATSLHNVFLGINLIQWRHVIGTVAGGSGTKLKSDNDFILTNNDLPDLTT